MIRYLRSFPLSRWVWLVAITLAPGVGAYFVTFSFVFAVGLSLVVGAVAATLLLVHVDAPDAWPPAVHRAAGRASEVSRLSWSVHTKSGDVGGTMIKRVQQLIRENLELEGVDVDDDADARRRDLILGAGVWKELQDNRVSIDRINYVLTLIESRGKG